MSKVTYETVAAAAESLVKDDKRASVRAVTAVLGGGSPNAILPLLNQWKAGRAVVAVADVQVDPRIGQIVAEQIAKASAEARSEIEQRLSETEADAAVIAEAGRQAEADLELAQASILVLSGQVQAQAGQIEQLKADAEAVKLDATERIAAAQVVAREAVAKAEEAAERERSELRSTQDRLAKAELRLEALPPLHDEIKQLRAALDAERSAKAAAESAKAAADAKAAGLSDRLTDAQTEASKAATVSGERLLEQNRSCTELASALKAEIQTLQQRLLAEKTDKTDKPAESI